MGYFTQYWHDRQSQKTNDGLEITTLCSPRYRVGVLVIVESKLIECNGDNKIKSIEHSGDVYSTYCTQLQIHHCLMMNLQLFKLSVILLPFYKKGNSK